MLVDYLGSEGMVYMLRAMAPIADQHAASLAGLGLRVFSIFLVPVTMIRGAMR